MPLEKSSKHNLIHQIYKCFCLELIFDIDAVTISVTIISESGGIVIYFTRPQGDKKPDYAHNWCGLVVGFFKPTFYTLQTCSSHKKSAEYQ